MSSQPPRHPHNADLSSLPTFSFALQLAAASGAIVIATSSSDDKLEIAKRLGATHGINYKKTPDWEKEVLRLTKDRGADHIIEVSEPY